MITAHRDVSDRVRAERARDAAVRMFEVTMSRATIGVGWRRLDGTLARVNPALCSILGRSAEQLVGHPLQEFATDDGSAFADAVAAVHAGARTHHESERQFLRPDGTVVWCLLTVVGLPDELGVVSSSLVQLQDITQQKKAVAQLEEAALTDPLTGLPNRTVLEDRLTRALGRARLTNTLVGVLFIDLDNFKSVNDHHGHDMGDKLFCARSEFACQAQCVMTTPSSVWVATSSSSSANAYRASPSWMTLLSTSVTVCRRPSTSTPMR